MTKWEAAGNMCNLVTSWKNLDMKTKQKGAFLMWCIWAERNRKVFENKITPNALLTGRVYRLVAEYGRYARCIYKQVKAQVAPSPNVWQAPTVGVVKLNTDASVMEEGWVGLGVVA